jgi:hypothetical protein
MSINYCNHLLQILLICEVEVLLVFSDSCIDINPILISFSIQGMDRFLSGSAQAFLRSLGFFPTEKTLHSDDIKKDEITPNYDSIAKTDVQNFPSTEQTKKIMFVVFGDDGLFMKDHFERSGEIDIEGCQTRFQIFFKKLSLFILNIKRHIFRYIRALQLQLMSRVPTF